MLVQTETKKFVPIGQINRPDRRNASASIQSQSLRKKRFSARNLLEFSALYAGAHRLIQLIDISRSSSEDRKPDEKQLGKRSIGIDRPGFAMRTALK